MTFLNPLMLAGLTAMLVPMVLHLLNRSRYRNVEWAAMMFLEGLDARQHRSTRLKQWVLLGVRMIIPGLIALALARPVLHGHGVPPAHPGRTAAVILLDRSASMSLNDNGRVRLDLAREAIFQLLSPGLRRGDDLWLLPLGERDPAAQALYAGDPQEMALRVKEVTTPVGEADVAAGLLDALDLLEKSQAPNREIYIVCDRQAGSWRNVDEVFARQWRQRLAQLPSGPPRVFIVPVGTDETDNVAVESIEPLEAFVAEQSSEVQIKVRNFGTVPRAGVLLKVGLNMLGGGKSTVRQMAINLPAGAATTTAIPITINEAGSGIIVASVSAPGLATDKELSFAIDVLPKIKVLIVDGDERESMYQSGSDFLKAALEPYANGKRNIATVAPIRPEMWTPTDLHDYRVVILANVPSFTETQAQSIEQFVYDGGGLILAPGDQCRADSYNNQFTWLPGDLQPATPESESGSTKLTSFALSHPLFRFLKGRADPTAGAIVRRYFPVQAKEGSPFSVLASYSDGKPFLTEASVGRGRVLLITTPVDTEWNALPLTNFFLPFMQSAVRYAATGSVAARMAHRNVAPGQALVADFDEPLDPKAIVIEPPRGGGFDPVALAVSQSGRTQVRYTDTHASGIYRVGAGAKKGVVFSVQTPSRESDLTPLSHERWRWLERELRCDAIDPDRRAIPVAQESIRAGWDMWLPLLGCAIVLSVLELSATRRWSGRGA